MSITALVVFVVWLLGLVLALPFEPIFALFSYLWIFYNDPQTSWWGSDLPPLRYSLFAAVAALIATRLLPVRAAAKWASSGAARLLIAFTVWMWLQTFWAINVSTHVDGAILCTKYLILSYVIYRLTGSEKGVKLFLAAHVAGCFLFGWRASSMNVSGRLETIVAPGVDDSNLGIPAMACLRHAALHPERDYSDAEPRRIPGYGGGRALWLVPGAEGL
jgi:hypothetical protein